MKTPFSSVLLPPFPQPMLQTPHGCLFVSNIEKGGRGGLPFMMGERRIHTKGKKGWSLSCVSTTSVHDCRKRTQPWTDCLGHKSSMDIASVISFFSGYGADR